MTKIDLITGFLGSGKTTFLKLYAKHLIDSGQNIGILENDYGAVNVDMMLLQELEGEHCELEMVSGACHADCHRRRFKTKLIALGMSGYDRVIVEPSGIFDTDEFFDVLREEPLNRMYTIGNVIAIVDAKLENDLSSDSDFYLASQIANAGAIMLSRTQLSDADQIDKTIEHLKSAIELVKADRNIDDIIHTDDWFANTADTIYSIMNAGYYPASYEKRIAGADTSYSSVYFLELPMTTKIIKNKIAQLMNNPAYGNIFRIKGFYNDNNQWYEVNATTRDLELKPIPLGQEVIIVIGEKLNASAIEETMKSIDN